jgi:hypothetical protein
MPALVPPRGRSRRGPWLATAAATLVSTYALDAAATAAGVGLVASGLLSGLADPVPLVFLAATYALWGAGLRVNLAANWVLLARTGASTNLLSKAAHDIATARDAGPRVRRFVASAGYAGTELAKEAPYYAGAAGAVLLSDAVGATDAILFLGGANLGAAAYEYGLARATRRFLRSRACASFDTDWVPAEYLADYYAKVEPDERETIAYFVDAMRHTERDVPILFYGVGPTLHHVFLAAPAASEIHVADYLPANLREIERWLASEEGAHDWRPFVAYTLTCEGTDPTARRIEEREALTRAKITRLLHADARDPEPLGAYATVVSAYCADSATDDRAVWRTYMSHITGAVRPGGLFITSALRRCRSYLVGGKPFPSADVDERDVLDALEASFGRQSSTVELREVPEHAVQGYAGIVLASARAPQ